MLKSGLSLQRSLHLLSRQMSLERHKIIIREILEEVQAGSSLAESFRKREVFPKEFADVTEAGEKSGQLAEVYEDLEEHYKNKEKLKKGIINAGIYPLTVITAVIISAFFLFRFIFPIFTELFAEYRAELPLLTRILLRISEVINNYFFLLLLLMIIIFLTLVLIFINRKYSSTAEKIIFKTPIIGRLYRYSILSRTALYLALLLKSGLELINALSLVENMLNSQSYSIYIRKTVLSVSKGSSLSESFADKQYIPEFFYYLLLTGEETAQMETMLERAGDHYFRKLNEETELLLQYLEPLLIIITAIFVALLAAGVMLPLFQIYLII